MKSPLRLYYKMLGGLCVYLYTAGRYDLALKLAKTSCEKSGESVNALNLYGIHLIQEGRHNEAFECFTKARKLNKNPVLDRMLATSIGSCYWQSGEIDKAISVIEELIPKYEYLNPNVYTTLGFFCIVKGDYENAKKYTEIALADNANYAPAYDNLGQISFKEGKNDNAIEHFEKALSLDPNMLDSKYYLGCAYENAGNKEKAKSYFSLANAGYINAMNTVTKQQVEEKFNKYKELDVN